MSNPFEDEDDSFNEDTTELNDEYNLQQTINNNNNTQRDENTALSLTLPLVTRSSDGLNVPTKCALRGINIRKLYKSPFFMFKKNKMNILNDLNINVIKGQIYGLLGPSGCGKTTLLKCLLGLMPIDSGQVIIDDGLKSKDTHYRLDLTKLGFMPQDCSLYNELTIDETFYYFAKLYRMSNKKIKNRRRFLMDLLELPSKNAFISNLSGGQLRRASLAVSLLNEPEILILDEPTVGMDPILRKKIWNYLTEISKKQNTTIIITTHYIEEARKADCLGFMRNGKIIEENSPEFFIQKYNQNILEDIFYTICAKSNDMVEYKLKSSDEDTKEPLMPENQSNVNNVCSLVEENLTVMVKSPSEAKKSNLATKCTSKLKKFASDVSFSRIMACIYKDVIKCKRNKKLLMVQLIVPIIQITLFCMCIGIPPMNLKLGIINNDNATDFPVQLGAEFVNDLNNQTLIKKNYANFDVGFRELKKGNIWGLVYIDVNFTAELVESFMNKRLPKSYNNTIHIYMDNTNHQISYAIRDAIGMSVKTVVERLMNHTNSKAHDEDLDEIVEIEDDDDESDVNTTTQVTVAHSSWYPTYTIINNASNFTSQKGAALKENKYPIVLEDSVYGEDEPIFTHFMAPGVALSVIFFMSVAATASNFVLERRLGLVERSYLIGVQTIELLFSQLFVYSIIMLMQIAIILYLLFVPFDIPLKGSVILLILLLFSQGFSGLCYGLFLASIIHEEETVIQATLASFYPMLLMNGIIWPIEAQPIWLKFISQFLPLTYATEAFRSILEKDWSLANLVVFRGFLATYMWTLFFCVCFLIAFSKKFR